MKNIAVIGAGTMGNGIAHVFAQNNFRVNLIDISPTQLDKAITEIKKNLDRQVTKNIISETIKNKTIENISTFTSLSPGVKDADLVIEAVTENLDLKLKIFREINEAVPENTILATNTSSVSITKIASVTKQPSHVIGMHFMNPVPVMKLVEIINGYATGKEVSKIIIELSRQVGKMPCEVNDFPGFIANRILMPMINEAIFSLYENVAGVEEIDTIMKSGMAHPMGPLQLADFIGLDVCYSILKIMQEDFGNPKYAPCPLLTNMVNANVLGIKTGEGFYKYTRGNKELVVSERFSKK
ncbi:MAG: 3-hydroxyacyl-CoA dehydrogenase NAD-binding domain-containing protein [Bacteroidota bacterium]|nr:3-hydroxyacyl-CoA dehydrogenase NAD-binding domain-containing protein [Bacteroidota bacterium]